ncbi:MAG: beta-lactamase family protein [Chthonomonadales bacterium]|nr:beta-lactamase family protein [Chthonomonadales bacterium]
MAAGDEPAARVASRGKSPFSLEAGIEGDTRLGVHGQGPDGVVLQQEQINGILVTRLGPGIPELDQLYTRMMALTNVPGAAFVLCYKGRLVYAAGFGYSNLEDKIPFTPYTLCEIGSVSKPLAAMTILASLEHYKIPLTARVYDLLGWKSGDTTIDAEASQATVLDCLNHKIMPATPPNMDATARMFNIPKDLVTEEHILQEQLRHGFKFVPGSKVEYSGFGLLLLARVVEKYEHKRFLDYEINALTRLNVGDFLSFSYSDDRRSVLVPPSYQYDPSRGEFREEGNYLGFSYFGENCALGTGVMSPLSLARFGDRFVDLYRDPARMSDLIINNRSDKNGGYALGWMVGKNNGRFYLHHGGSIGGWKTGLMTGFINDNETNPNNSFTVLTVFNAECPPALVAGQALVRQVPDSMFDEFKVPRELIPNSLQSILPRLIQRGKLNNFNLWRSAGFPD